MNIIKSDTWFCTSAKNPATNDYTMLKKTNKQKKPDNT